MHTLQFLSQNEQAIDYGVDGVTLFRYVYHTQQVSAEVPKPFLHPLCTLAGHEVTIHRPHDHRWHAGLMMTMSHLNDRNFWGGPSYVEGQGYQNLGNHGRIDHTGFSRIEVDGDYFLLEESLVWKPTEAATWLQETRQIQVTEVNRADSYWMLSFRMALHNVSGEALAFGSPTTHGRPQAGYGSLFWRGPRSFTGGQVIGPQAQEDYMGEPLPWLAFCGTHDGADAQSTLLFIDDSSNPRYPNKWFVRTTPYACVSFSFMFDETYTLPADGTLSLTYHIAVFDGARNPETLARVAAKMV